MNKDFKKISIDQFSPNIFSQWDNQWFLLTCGDFASGEYNTMTVAWGGFGIMWNLPIAMIVVRPSRFTFGFLNNYDSFTLCAFPKKYQKALTLLGTKSGRDGDKIAESGLTPVASKVVQAPFFKEAELSIACQKIYFDDFKPANFLDNRIEPKYDGSDYHRMVYGEVLAIYSDSEKYN